MRYGGEHGFPTHMTRGIFVPTKCSQATPNMLPFFAEHLKRNTDESVGLNLQHNEFVSLDDIFFG